MRIERGAPEKESSSNALDKEINWLGAILTLTEEFSLHLLIYLFFTDDDIRQTEGFKNVSLGNVLSAQSGDQKITFLNEQDAVSLKFIQTHSV